ncbi:hypothetical protein D3C72_2443140 [compost metagenome]
MLQGELIVVAHAKQRLDLARNLERLTAKIILPIADAARVQGLQDVAALVVE